MLERVSGGDIASLMQYIAEKHSDDVLQPAIVDGSDSKIGSSLIQVQSHFQSIINRLSASDDTDEQQLDERSPQNIQDKEREVTSFEAQRY